MTSPQVIAFVEGDVRNKEYMAVSLYLEDCLWCGTPTDAGRLLTEFCKHRERLGIDHPTRFDSASLFSAGFARWYWAMEQVEAGIVPYNGDWDWLVRCEWNEDRPVVTRAP